MKERLEKVNKWKSVTSKRIPELIEVYDYFITGEESKNYKECKCDSSLRIMFFDLKKYYINYV